MSAGIPWRSLLHYHMLHSFICFVFTHFIKALLHLELYKIVFSNKHLPDCSTCGKSFLLLFIKCPICTKWIRVAVCGFHQARTVDYSYCIAPCTQLLFLVFAWWFVLTGGIHSIDYVTSSRFNFERIHEMIFSPHLYTLDWKETSKGSAGGWKERSCLKFPNRFRQLWSITAWRLTEQDRWAVS